MGQVSVPVLVWPAGCGRPGCKHHYGGQGRNPHAEGCICPGWLDDGGWHLTGTSPSCASPAHVPVHTVFPLDAHESEWRCRTCGHVFMSTSGWAVCPHDPDPPLPARTPPVHVPEPGGHATGSPDDLVARLRIWADGHPYYGPAADLAELDRMLSGGDWPYPTRWAVRAMADVPLPGDAARDRRAAWLARNAAALADAAATASSATWVANSAIDACPDCTCTCGHPDCTPTAVHYAAAGTICRAHQAAMAAAARFGELFAWLAEEFPH